MHRLGDVIGGQRLGPGVDGARAVLAAMGRGSREDDGTYAAASLARFTYLQLKLNVP